MTDIITLVIGIIITLTGLILFKKELDLYRKTKGYAVLKSIVKIVTSDLPSVVWYVEMIVGGILLTAFAVFNII